jgi:hypothetical protein
VSTFLVSLVVFAAVLAAMAVGVVLGGRRLRGSCGLTGDDCACSLLQARRCSNREV